MRTIIAGSRSITKYSVVCAALELVPWPVTTVISGGARGVDRLGELWARRHGNIPIESYPADWGNINVEGARIKKGPRGHLYNASAGMIRNKLMAENAEALVAIWDGKSRGTEDMITLGHQHKLQVFVHLL